MKYALLSLILFMVLHSMGQFSIKDTSLSIPMFYAVYAVQFPGGDLADRFGTNSTIGGGFLWKTSQNWFWGTDFHYLFGNDLKNEEDLLQNIKTQTGHIIDMGGTFANYHFFERGYYATAKIGKLFPVLSPNPNSGFVVLAGAGYFQHKIRIEVENNSAPQLAGDYKRGYDRLTGGFMLNQFVGYMYLGNSRVLNFFGGVEFCQAWTKPFREVNFDTRLPDEKSRRMDRLTGFRVGWIIPIFPREPEKFYFY
ncbi:MAG: hypothetical protein ACNA7V_04600 [Bacteroidales bacterium]